MQTPLSRPGTFPSPRTLIPWWHKLQWSTRKHNGRVTEHLVCLLLEVVYKCFIVHFILFSGGGGGGVFADAYLHKSKPSSDSP